jgi:hypothetical protein
VLGTMYHGTEPNNDAVQMDEDGGEGGDGWGGEGEGGGVVGHLLLY